MDQNTTAAPPQTAVSLTPPPPAPPSATVSPAPASPTPPSPPPPPAERPWSFGLIEIAVLVGILAFFLGSFRVSNSDTWLTLATGKLLATGQYQFGVDPFSWASAGTYWANPSWLSSLGAYLIYETLGGSALVQIKALIVVACAGFLFKARFKEAPLLPALELTALALIAASPRFIMQSSILSFAGLALLLWLLTRDGYLGGKDAADKAKPLWQIPLLFLAWSNLDGYFILGLALVALVAIGLAVFADGRRTALRLAAIFGLSLVACVLNPHLFANFTLPTDLAYLFQGILPTSMAAAGETVDAYVKAGDTSFVSVSPFTSTGVSEVNFSISGLAFYLLVVVNVLSFVVCGFVPGDRSYFARALACLALLVLAAIQYRLAPFYAIVAGPMSLHNFTEYVRWSKKGKPYAPGMGNFAMVMTTLALIVVLILAWPGWLHLGLTQFNDDSMYHASRRVEWECRPEPSPHHAALVLGEEARAHRIHNVYNVTPEIAHYCAFFAPEVKCGIDSRMALFAAKAPEYLELRKELWNHFRNKPPKTKDDPPDPPTWPKTIVAMNVDVVVIAFSGRPPAQSLRLRDMMLLSQNRWKPIVADGLTFAAVFSGPGAEWKGHYLLDKWAREAFAPRPEKDWLPGDGEWPPSESTWWKSYFIGPGAKPLESSTGHFEWTMHQIYARLWEIPYYVAWQSQQPLVVGNAGGGAGVTLGLDAVASLVHGEREPRRPRGPEHQWFVGVDLGPPALPILARRDLRRSIEKNPNLPETYELFAQVTRQMSKQENWWAAPRVAPLRDQLRTVEIMTALRNAANLAPDNFEYRLQLTRILLNMGYLDAAAAENAEGLRILEASSASAGSLQRHFPLQFAEIRQLEATKQLPPGKDHYKAQYEKNCETTRNDQKKLKDEIKVRLDDLDLKTAGKTELERFLIAAMLPWRYTDAKNNQREEPSRGLMLEGIRTLEKADVKTWSPEQKRGRAFFLIQLYCFQGKVKEALDTFVVAKDDLGPKGVECQAWIFAAIGAYEKLDEALAVLEENALRTAQGHALDLRGDVPQNETVRDDLVRCLVRSLSLNRLIELPAGPRIEEAIRAQTQLAIAAQQTSQFFGQVSDIRTLRGIYALERGATDRALGFFEKALADELPFFERLTAQRYRDLLRQEGNK